MERQMDKFSKEINEEEGSNFDFIEEEERQVNIERSTYSIYEIVRRYKRGDIIIKPFYQRNSVWPNSKKSKLIESVIRNIPIPSFYFAELDDGRWEVVDGQQRLRAFIDFINGDYKLTSLPVLTNLNLKSFDDLGLHKRKIEDYILHIFIIKKNSHPDIRFDIFERINEGATQLNAQELRNSMFRDGEIEFLKILSKNTNFIKLTKGKISENRLKDDEAVLRYLSFYKKNYKTNYNGNMNAFLNDTMRNFQSYFLPSDYDNIINNFDKTMELIYEILGENAFLRQNGRKVNMSLFDVLTYSFSQNSYKNILLYKEKINALYNYMTEENEKFIKTISTNTLAKQTVIDRFDMWNSEFDKIIKEGSLVKRF